MERFLLYLDDLDDAIFAVAFLGERGGQFLRRYLFGICGVSAAVRVDLAGAVDASAGRNRPRYPLARPRVSVRWFCLTDRAFSPRFSAQAPLKLMARDLSPCAQSGLMLVHQH